MRLKEEKMRFQTTGVLTNIQNYSGWQPCLPKSGEFIPPGISTEWAGPLGPLPGGGHEWREALRGRGRERGAGVARLPEGRAGLLHLAGAGG